jgi:Domain of unknown function (DUF4179)
MERNPPPDMVSEEHGEYADILDPGADYELVGLVHEMDAVFAAIRSPEDLARSPLRQGQPMHDWHTTTAQHAKWTEGGRLMRFTPRSAWRAVALVAIAALLLTGVVYAGESVLNRVFQLDPGTQQILQGGQYQTIGMSHTFADTTLSIERAYADANRVIVGYTLTPVVGSRTPSDPQVGLDLRTRGGTILPVRADAGYVDPGSTNANVISFDASDIGGNPSELPLHLEARTRAGDTWEVDFTLPFHAGRVVQPHQRLTSNGGTATLEKAVLTPSEMRIYLSGVGEDFRSHLSIGNWLDGWDSDHGPVGVVSTWITPAGLSAISFPAALYQRHGEWTLQVDSPGNMGMAQPAHSDATPSPLGGPWTFHFVIP